MRLGGGVCGDADRGAGRFVEGMLTKGGVLNILQSDGTRESTVQMVEQWTERPGTSTTVANALR